MQGHFRADGLWMPGERKQEGGSYFDDELVDHQTAFENQTRDLIAHVNARPDHTVYVASVEDREKMRAVFNHWFRTKVIGHNPNIRIEYALADGSIRVGE